MSTQQNQIETLKRALQIAEQIQNLEEELNGLIGQLGGNKSTPQRGATPEASAPSPRKGKRSTAVRERMAAAQRARWARHKTAEGAEKPAKKVKRQLSPEGRARIAEAAKKRWANARKK